jgi:hypothetical protein
MANLTSASDLSLKISIDSSHTRVKCYDFIPDLGIVHAFGVYKGDRHELGKCLTERGLDRRDCIYLLLREMSINYIGVSQNLTNRLHTHCNTRAGNKNWDRVVAFYAIRPILNTNIAEYAEYTCTCSISWGQAAAVSMADWSTR